MARRAVAFRIRTVGVHEQKARIELRWPGLKCSFRDGTLVCRGRVQPTPMSRAYTIRLEYSVERQPRVRVEDPPLRRRESAPDQPIPHTYRSREPGRERPCLYFPHVRVWRSDKLLADTVIPWLHTWLAHYEIWHITGEWRGGGIDHGDGDDK